MNPRSRLTGFVLFASLVAMASPLHGQVPGELGTEDLAGIREAHSAARWSDGLTEGNPAEASATAALVSVDEGAYLKPRNAGAGDFFATVAVSGDTVVVGAPFEDSKSVIINGNGSSNKVINSGAAYVFVRISGKWTQQAYLKAGDGAAGDQFGFSVAISDDTVVVGSYAAGDITKTPGKPATDTTPETKGTTTVTKNLGAAYVFTRNAAKWTQQAVLKPVTVKADAGDAFGYSVAVDGNTAVIGAIGEASKSGGVNGTATDNTQAQAGAAYVFSRSGTSWTQQGYLKASKPERGDLFGIAVAIAGDTVVVGAPNESSNGKGADGGQGNNLAKSSGAAYVFTRKGQSWKPQSYLKASNAGAGDQFGRAVGISGESIIVGAPEEASAARGLEGNQANNRAAKAGAAYLFSRNQTKWVQQAYFKASKSGAGDLFGFAVAISDDTAVVGAMNADSNGKDAGAAYVFTRSKSVWRAQSVLKASNRGAGDKLGFSVAVAGEIVVCGAPGEASNAKKVDGNKWNNSAKNAGASYVFEGVRVLGPSIAVEQPFGSALALGKRTVSFGDTISTVPVAKTFSIVNNGTTPLIGISVSVTGANSADFSVDTTGLATTVLPGGRTTFIVTFASASFDPRTAMLVIRSSDKNEGQFFIAVQGNGVSAPQIGLNLADGTNLADGDAVDLGQARIRATGMTRVFTISNVGNTNLKSLALSVYGLNKSDFSVSSLGVTQLAPGENTSFRVTFKPSARGKRTAIVKVASNDTKSGPFNLNIFGSGTAVSKREKTVAPSLAGIVPSSLPASSVASSASSVEVVGGAKFLALTLTKPTDGSAVGTVQVSPDLLDWYSGSRHTTILIDDATTLKVRDNSPITADSKRYIRIK